MPTFTYIARDQQGLAHTGQIDGASDDEVVVLLQHRGLLVTSLSKKDLAQPSAAVLVRHGGRRMHRGVTIDDQVLLCQELATLIGAGVPLLRSLEVVSAQVESRRLLHALEQVYRSVGAGSTLVAALAKHPSIFSRMWLNLAETGEASGHLGGSLEQLARHFEATRHLQNEAKTALTYPTFLLGAAALVCAVFVYWLIPKFQGIFTSMPGMELPAITRIVIGISEAGRRYVIVLILAAVGGSYLIRRYLATDAGQWMRDRLLLRVPVFQTLFSYIQLAEFSRGLATLLESGVPLLSTLEILEGSATNKLYGQAIGRIREQVKEGRTMAEPMAQSALFPPLVVQMTQVGEEIGELATMAGRIAKHYEERLSMAIARMTRLFEPIAIIVMAVIVLFVVLSIFLPIFQMSTGIH